MRIFRSCRRNAPLVGAPAATQVTAPAARFAALRQGGARACLLLALLLAAARPAAAQTPTPLAPAARPGAPAAAPDGVVARIGYINMDKVFTEYYKTKEADARLRDQRDAARKYVAEKQQQIKDLQEKLDALTDPTNDVLLTPKAVTERREQVATLRQEYQYRVDELESFSNDKMGQLVHRFEDERARILTEVMDQVRDLATAQNLQVVLDLSGKTQAQLAAVFFYKGTDLTAPVLAVLNAGQPVAPPAVTPPPALAPPAPPPRH